MVMSFALRFCCVFLPLTSERYFTLSNPVLKYQKIENHEREEQTKDDQTEKMREANWWRNGVDCAIDYDVT